MSVQSTDPVVTMDFSVTGQPEVVDRFARLLVVMHLASSWGSSRIFGMPLDGDGADIFKVKGDGLEQVVSDVHKEVDRALGTGRDIVLAGDDSYSSERIQS